MAIAMHDILCRSLSLYTNIRGTINLLLTVHEPSWESTCMNQLFIGAWHNCVMLILECVGEKNPRQTEKS